MMEGVLGCIYLYVNLYMKKRLLPKGMHKRKLSDRFVGKEKVSKKQRQREYAQMKMNERKKSK